MHRCCQSMDSVSVCVLYHARPLWHSPITARMLEKTVVKTFTLPCADRRFVFVSNDATTRHTVVAACSSKQQL